MVNLFYKGYERALLEKKDFGEKKTYKKKSSFRKKRLRRKKEKKKRNYLPVF